MANRAKDVMLFVAVSLVLVGCKPQAEVSISDTAQTEASNEFDLRARANEIVKEPDYGGVPYYALLAFGEEAETQTWLVVDGKTVYLDRNGNGDLTEQDERIRLDEEATANNVSGSSEYTGFNVFDLGNIAGHDFVFEVWVINEDFRPEPNEKESTTRYRQERLENGWMNASLYRTSEGGAQIPVLLCPKPQHAQISHIAGPLTFDLKWRDQKLDRDASPIFDIHIGTPGVAILNGRSPVFSNLSTEQVPEHIIPTAVFTFANQKDGDKPIVLTVNLDLRC